MSLNADLFILLIFGSLFKQNDGGWFQKIDKPDSESFSQYYVRIRNQNVYRGVLLSKSSTGQKDFCRDILSSPYFKIKKIKFADEEQIRMRLDSDISRVGDPDDIIVIKRIVSEKNLIAEEEMFLTCYGMYDGPSLQILPYYLSSGFKTDMYYGSRMSEQSYRAVEIGLLGTYYDISTSPEQVDLDQFQVEDLFIRIHQNIDTLRNESPRYIEMVEARDDIQALSEDERLAVCASILSIPFYQSQNLFLDYEWAHGNREDEGIYQRPLHFWKDEYESYNDLLADTVLCRAVETDAEKQNALIFHYTRSYSNENSVFFIEKQASQEIDLDFDSYIKNIPTLINASRKFGASHTQQNL